ncbi:histidinol-phosphate transaminase [Candidatus Sumerlaeota bacterium]|nr:histidinol-phosphate transaminase [Candidatus Sumerlaeota bacterium]
MPARSRNQPRKTLSCRPHLLALQPYSPGRPIEDVQREYGLRNVIKLASNENPLGPSPKAVAAIRRSVRNTHLYPDGHAYYLRQALSRYHGVRPDQLMFGNGTDELIIWLALTYLSPRDSVIVSQYSFVRYQMAAQLVGARWKTIPLDGWQHNLRAMARAVGPSTRIIFLGNPDNPVGTIVGRKEFERFLKAAPRRVLIVLDQAYYEYVQAKDYFSGIEYVAENPNLVALRTFSKAYGLAGLRIGYGVAHPQIVSDVNRVRPPFNVNRLAQEAAIAALGDNDFLRRTVEANEAGRRYLCGEFDRLGLEHVPSHTNFVLVRAGRPHANGDAIAQAMMRQGVIVRPMTSLGLTDYVRITIGLPRENRRAISVLRRVLRSLGE